METTVAVLGTGAMGSALVRRLSLNSYRVVAWNRTRAKAEPLLSLAHVSVVDEAKDAASSATDISGRTFVCTMTISPEKSKEFAGIVAEREGVWVEAPVLGNQFVAEEGKLQVCVGSTREQFDMLVPILSSFGTPRYIGEVGKATTMKLGLNYILGANIVAFSNSFGLMSQAGVPLDVFTEVLSKGPLNLSGGYYSAWSQKMQDRNYDPAVFPTTGIQKDVTLAVKEMKMHGINTSVAEGILANINDAIENYETGEKDFSSVYESSNPLKKD